MAPRGARNGQWRGDGVGYKSLHVWVRRNFPMTGRCAHCERTDRATEYASIGHVYTRNRDDWIELCRSCHRIMDGPYERTPEIRAAVARRSRGRHLSPESRAKISASKTGVRLGPMAAEHRAKIGASKTEQVRRGQALAMWRNRHAMMQWACS